MGSGTIRTGLAGDWVVFTLDGELRCVCGFDFANFVDLVFEEGAPAGAIIDLRKAHYIDSTNLGILARIGRKSHEAGLGAPYIVSTSDEIGRVLDSMGFLRVFRVVGTWPAELPEAILCTELGKCDAGAKDQARCFLDAHCELVDLAPDNESKFSDVIKFLRQEADQSGG